MSNRVAIVENFGMICANIGGHESPARRLFQASLHSQRRRGIPVPFRATLPIDEIQSEAGLSGREAKRMDRFSMLSIAACQRALNSCGLGENEKKKCGLIVGNMAAGWTFTEPQLDILHSDGPQYVSPYLASAWFPAAAQGQISIKLGLRGYAKTIATDRSAGSQAVSIAVDRIKFDDGVKRYLAGGVDAPITPFVKSAFEIDQSGKSLVEGAAFLLVSSRPATRSGGYVKIKNHPSSSMYSRMLTFDNLAQYPRRIFVDAKRRGNVPDAVIYNTPVNYRLEKEVRLETKRLLRNTSLPVFFSSSVLGDSLAASGPMALGLAYLSLKEDFQGFNSILVITMGHQCAHAVTLYK